MFYVECSRMLRKVLWGWYGAIIESSQVQAFWIWDKRLSWRDSESTWPWPGPELDNFETLYYNDALLRSWYPIHSIFMWQSWHYVHSTQLFHPVQISNSDPVTSYANLHIFIQTSTTTIYILSVQKCVAENVWFRLTLWKCSSKWSTLGEPHFRKTTFFGLFQNRVYTDFSFFPPWKWKNT